MEITKEEWLALVTSQNERLVAAVTQVLQMSLQRMEEVYKSDVESEKPDPAVQAVARFKHYRALFAGEAMRELMKDKELPDEQIVKEAFQLADMMAEEANR